MAPQVVTVTPGTTLAELADLLISQRIGGVPVVEDDTVVGVVSRSDFARVISLDRSLAGLVAEGDWQEEFAPGELPEPGTRPAQLAAATGGHTVREVMVAAPVTVSGTQPGPLENAHPSAPMKGSTTETEIASSSRLKARTINAR